MLLAGIVGTQAADETFTYATGDGTWITENVERLYQSTNFSFLHKKNSSSSNIATTYSELRVYASHSMEVYPTVSGKTITSIEVTTGSTTYATAMGNATILAGTNSGTAAAVTGIASINDVKVTFNFSGVAGCEYVKFSLAAQSRTLSWKITYSDGGTSTPTVATPTFDPVAGTYTSTQNVTISTATADALIYFTTNGDEPTELPALLYTNPVSVSTSTTLKAKAFKAGMNASNTSTAVYTINPTPTITVTEVDVPAMNCLLGYDDTEIINVTGTNLTENIELTISAIDGFDASVFSVTSPLPSTGGVATITFTPTVPGLFKATLKLNSTGATEITRTLTGNATLRTPTAYYASGVSPTGFTASWEPVDGATSFELSVYRKSSSGIVASDLFFSEYVEGSSNNKALEIYNGTGAAVDLSQYKVELYSNGSAAVGNMLSMTGILNHNDVYVIYNSSANAAIQAVGDAPSTVTYFNGDDAIVLKKGETIIDIIGRVGEDPGTEWSATGGYSTLDKTLVRKSTVTGGVTVNPESGFPTLATEWDVYTQDYIDNLGSHTMSGAGTSLLHIDGSPFTLLSDSEKNISGLMSDTEYFYTVIAKNGSYSSPVSNEIAVVTSKHTGIEQTKTRNNIYVQDGKVMFNSLAGEIVEIYNSIGQRLINKKSVEGLNSIAIEAKGILLVKVGNRVEKVIF